MPEIHKPMSIPELSLKPPIDGKVRLSDDMQQTLALLTGYCDSVRKILKASQSGVLNVASAQIKEIAHFTGVGANDTQKGFNAPCTECLIMGHPDNTGLVWVRPYKGAATSNAWPLAANDVVCFSIDNVNDLNMLIVVDGEKLIVAYTR